MIKQFLLIAAFLVAGSIAAALVPGLTENVAAAGTSSSMSCPSMSSSGAMSPDCMSSSSAM